MQLLIIAPSWVGDILISNSLMRHLKKQYPQAMLDVFVPAYAKDLVEAMPEARHSWLSPLQHGELSLKKRYLLAQPLKKKHYDAVYILPNSFKSALIPFFARIDKRIGYIGEWRYPLLTEARKLDVTRHPLMVERYNALAYSPDTDPTTLNTLYPHLVLNQETVDLTLAKFSLTPPYIVFCPGAEYGPAKRWPHYHYAALAKHLNQEGYPVLLLGSKKDQSVSEAIINEGIHQNALINLTGKTSLKEAIALIQAASAIISNDSGLMHIAAALDKPLVALFGPTSPQFTPPLSKKAQVLRLIEGFEKVRVGQDSKEGYHQSLIDLSPKKVKKALDQVLK